MLVVDGAALVEDKFGQWIAPAGSAAWIPAGMRHSVRPAPSGRVRTLYIWRAPRTGCRVIGTSLLLRALVGHVCKREGVAGDAAGKRLAAVLLDQIAAQPELPLFVPALRSPLTERVARALQSDPADTPRIRDLAAELGVSDRTIERAFVNDTGMTIGEWRLRSRMRRAIELLAAGSAVKDVALEAGYATASAFIAAFKDRVGATPRTVATRITKGITKNTKEYRSS
jgi:AraC-like DNA-binding protein